MSLTQKEVLIVTGAPGFSYANSNSAVARYLLVLRDALLVKGYKVNTIPPLVDMAPVIPGPTGVSISSRVKRLFRSLVPSLYHAAVNYRYFKKQARLFDAADAAGAKADLIIEFLTYGSDIGSRLKQKYNKPLVVIYDSPLKEQYEEMYGKGAFFSSRIEKMEHLSLQHADTVICYSEPVKRHIAASSAASAKVEVLPCIIWKDPVVANPSTEAPVIGFIGSFLKWHKVELLVDAFRTIGQEFPSSRLVLLGWGEEWRRISHMVDAHPLKHRIEMPGFVDEEALNKWKRQFTIGVMPGSNWYGSPLKLFEYAQARIPVIAPASPTVSSLFVKNEEAIFIDADNELESLIDSLRRLLNDKLLRDRLVCNAFKKMETEFAKEHQTLIFTEIINKTIQSGIKK